MPVGAPIGNQNGKKGTKYRDAIRWALANYDATVALEPIQRGKALRAIAWKAVEQAAEGDKEARREIGDRLDGKPAQAVDVNASGDLSLTVQIMRFGAVRDDADDSTPA